MPIQATETRANRSTNVAASRVLTYGLLAAIVAAVGNGIVFVVATEAFGVPAGFPLSWVPVLASSVLPAVVATVVYAVLARLARRPNRTFSIVAAIVLVLSYAPFVAPPPELSGAPLSVFGTLGAMHVVAAVAIVGTLTRVHPSDGSSRDEP